MSERLLEIFATADIPSGQGHYAERFDASHPLLMPFNAYVNLAYTAVGVVWLLRLRFQPNPIHSNRAIHNAYLLYYLAFAWAAIGYSFIQFQRITTQDRFWGLLDQWVTLPIFALVPAWTFAIHRNFTQTAAKPAIHVATAAFLLAASALSYFAEAFFPRGFEISLGIHIVLAAYCAQTLVRDAYAAFCRQRSSSAKDKSNANFKPIAFALLLPVFGALVSCLGFVFLKIYDFEVTAHLDSLQLDASIFHTGHPEEGSISAAEGAADSLLTNQGRITGHFLSKICDAMQIHFMLLFFTRVVAHVHVKDRKD
ncbi:hypothetical protein CAOG_01305 [Capsaspora owczarzaki ATCC 30864]|uniref:Uncharacterized protein n=1 Tax=Capsaspora owczarzaki (strain ATCC 30864) TaxID=595528 RepID=A0A0D2WIX7_CAPO3|nr:hypothetical protein CAOG_01305 [Capsaspora owczarzaki ATCC 30864]KJE89900.1 hypothetical protein CAOG_001305 [Capsaspora owczarzaki ATCC 30864]|eukprot:XP_004349825.2 hypothetical protein CAOG_01305 [Capsaspora owczarzaki ATCC 30864]